MPDGSASLETPTRADDTDDLLREWLRSAEERFAWFKHVASSAEVRTATKQFAKPSGNGRARGRLALERAFQPCAFLEARGDEGRLPFLLWSIIRPRPELRVVSVNFAATIRFPDGRASIVSMSWTIDAAEAALEAAIRYREQNLDELLLGAHRALLDAPATLADVAADLALPAGCGHFVGRFGQARAGNEPYLIFQAERWMPGLDTRDVQTIRAAGEGEARLSDYWSDPTRLAGAQFGG